MSSIASAAAVILLAGILNVPYLSAQPEKYKVYQTDSFLLAITDKAGLLSFAAGHKHAIVATEWQATLNLNPDDLENSSIRLTIPVSSLVIDSKEARQKANLGAGPSEQDVHEIQQRLLSSEVLDPKRYPKMQFTSAAIRRAGAERLSVTGTFEMHGHSRQITFPVRYKHYETGGFGFYGKFTIRQTDFGLTPQSVAGGTVKVKDQVTIEFQISMVPAP